MVVEAVPGGGERPVKATVHARGADGLLRVYTARSDEAGRFSLRRPDQDIGLYVTTTDRVAAMRVAKGTDEVKVILGPGATASGRVVDAAGRPLAEEGPWLVMTRGPGNVPTLVNLTPLSRFEAGGALMSSRTSSPGAEYRATFRRGPDALPIKSFRIEGPGPIDLGDLVVPAAGP